jgi:hypothetical protein
MSTYNMNFLNDELTFANDGWMDIEKNRKSQKKLKENEFDSRSSLSSLIIIEQERKF